MADLERLTETSELRSSVWTRTIEDDESHMQLRYDELVDDLTLLIVPKDTPTIVHYVDENIGLLYEPDSLEVVGIRVEAFRRSFLPQYSDIQETWNFKKAIQLEDFGDLISAIQEKESIEPEVARQLSCITQEIVMKSGLELCPPA